MTYVLIMYLCTYLIIYLCPSRSSFDLSCTDELSKSETAAVYRLMEYIYTSMYMYIYIHIYIYIYVCMYIYIYKLLIKI